MAPSQRTSMPISRNTVTMPVSWQIGWWPSAHMRELIRIWAMASRAAGDLLVLVGGGEVPDVVGRVVVGDVLQRVGDRLDEVVLADGNRCAGNDRRSGELTGAGANREESLILRQAGAGAQTSPWRSHRSAALNSPNTRTA